MKRLKLALPAAVLLGLTAGSAIAADTCTDANFEARVQALQAYIKANPAKAEILPAAAKEVEKDYGGEPSKSERCEAVDKLLAKVKAS